MSSSPHTAKAPGLYGVLGEFASPEALLEGAAQMHRAGFRVMDAFSPFPIEGLTDAIGRPRTRLPRIMFFMGLAGCVTGLLLCAGTAAYDYPINIGGRPLFSLPSFIPPMFELTILFASFSGVIGMFALNGLPRPYHPVFNVPRFAERASCDGFFLCVEAKDPQFEVSRVKTAMKEAKAEGVYEVEE